MRIQTSGIDTRHATRAINGRYDGDWGNKSYLTIHLPETSNSLVHPFCLILKYVLKKVLKLKYILNKVQCLRKYLSQVVS